MGAGVSNRENVMSSKVFNENLKVYRLMVNKAELRSLITEFFESKTNADRGIKGCFKPMINSKGEFLLPEVVYKKTYMLRVPTPIEAVNGDNAVSRYRDTLCRDVARQVLKNDVEFLTEGGTLTSPRCDKIEDEVESKKTVSMLDYMSVSAKMG